MIYLCEYGVRHQIEPSQSCLCRCSEKFGSDYDLMAWARAKYPAIDSSYHLTDIIRNEYVMNHIVDKPMVWIPRQGDIHSRKLLRKSFTEKIMASISKEELLAVKELADKRFAKAISTGRIGRKMLKELTMCILRHKYNCPY